MSTEVAFLNETRAELNHRCRDSLSEHFGVVASALVRVYSVLEVRGSVHVRRAGRDDDRRGSGYR